MLLAGKARHAEDEGPLQEKTVKKEEKTHHDAST